MGLALAAFLDRLHDLLEVALVLVEIDRRRIVRAEAGFLAFHQGGFDERVLRFLLAEVPHLEGFVGEENGAVGASELHAGGVAGLGPGAGGALDHAERTVLELHRRDDAVLDLDALVRLASGDSGDSFRRAGEVEQRIDGVHGLVHQRTATIERPGAAPSGGIVVCLVAIPFHIGRGGGELAETTFVGRLLEGIHAGMETAVQHGGEGLAVLGSGLDELVDALGGDLERLLADHVLACVQGGERGVEVRSRRRADGDDFQLGIGEEFIDVRVSLAAIFRREFFRSLAAQVEDGLEFAAGHGGDGLCVEVADHAGADDSEFHRGKGFGFVTR